MGSRSKKIRVHVAKIDKNSNQLQIFPHSVNEYAKKLGSLIDFDKVNPNSLISINASFFQAGTNLPVGITVLNNEILQIKKYKNWSSIIFTDDSIYFDELDLSSIIKFGSNKVSIDRYNYRTDSNQIVAYNSLYIDEFPILNEESIDSFYLEFLIQNNYNSHVGDDTEPPISFSEFTEIYKSTYDYDTLNYFYFKATPTENISINMDIKYIIKNESSFPINLNKGEILIESKIKFPLFDGDTIGISTNINSNLSNVNHIITTTPLLLKDGKEFVNSQYEGATSRRFNYDHLSRSAFGYNSDSYFFVSVEPNQGKKVKGATLLELSWIMETIGATEAINMDGGGSTCFVLNGKNLSFKFNQNYVRNVSTGISIFITR